MKTPYQQLDVTEQASDAQIKQAYLQKVRENPPDRAPECFQAIQAAYQSIKDAKSRLAYALFSLPSIDFNDLLGSAFVCETAAPALSADELLALLKAGVDEKTLLNAIPIKTA